MGWDFEENAQGTMKIADLQSKLARAEGPALIIAQAGQINSGSFDSFSDLADLAEAHNGWLQVDGAFGMWANASPLYARLCTDVERADSWAVGGHKWVQVPYESGYAIVKDPEAHRRAMDQSASYLNHSAED